MSTLLRSPRRVGSWDWNLEGRMAPDLKSALQTGSRMTSVLSAHGLMHRPGYLAWDWFLKNSRNLGITTELLLGSRYLDEDDLMERILGCRPLAFPEAEIVSLSVIGQGTYLDAAGRPHAERNLVKLIVQPADFYVSATLEVFHDIWADYDFSGNPHPEVYQRNAPRLAGAIRDLNALLGVAGEPDIDDGFFAVPDQYGFPPTDPDDLVDGRAVDFTDRL